MPRAHASRELLMRPSSQTLVHERPAFARSNTRSTCAAPRRSAGASIASLNAAQCPLCRCVATVDSHERHPCQQVLRPNGETRPTRASVSPAPPAGTATSAMPYQCASPLSTAARSRASWPPQQKTTFARLRPASLHPQDAVCRESARDRRLRRPCLLSPPATCAGPPRGDGASIALPRV